MISDPVTVVDDCQSFDDAVGCEGFEREASGDDIMHLREENIAFLRRDASSDVCFDSELSNVPVPEGTVEMHFRLERMPSEPIHILNRDAAYSVSIHNDGSMHCVFRVADEGIAEASLPSGSIKANTWQHMALTYDDAEAKCHLNGSLSSPGVVAPRPNPQNYRVCLGQFGKGLLGAELDIDFFRVSSRKRSVDEIYN